MARGKSKKKEERVDVLLPEVTEDVAPVATKAHSEEERRAEATLESIERELFGTLASHKPRENPPTKGKSEKKPTAKEPTSTPITQPAPDPVPEQPMVPPVAEKEDEGEVIEPTVKRQDPVLTARRKTMTESSTEDFKFLLDMDYENELGNMIGFEKIKAYHEYVMNGRASTKRRGRKEREFESQTQDATLRRDYAKQKRGRILHLVLSVLLLLCALVYERPSVMARAFGGLVDGLLYPTPYILIGIQILVLSVALSYQTIWEGFKRLVRFSPTDSSFTSVVALASFLYHGILLIIPRDEYPALYLSPLAFGLALCSFVDFLNWRRESMAFEVVASSNPKFGLVPRASVGNKRDSAREALFRDIREDETYYYVRPVGFVRNYISNTAGRAGHQRYLGLHLILSLAFGIAFGLFALAGNASGEMVLRTVFATMLLTAPMASLLLTSVPMFFAAVLRLCRKSAIIGEKPVEESVRPVTLVLPDHEIFEAMEHEHLHLMENCDLHSLSVMTYALLQKVGSPLAESFGVDTTSRMDPERLVLTEIVMEGVTAVDSETSAQISFGTISYMKDHGIPVRGLADDIPDSVSSRMLCVAMNGRISALFLVRYRFTSDARALLRELDQADVPVAIRSKDPCVRPEVFDRLLAARAAPLRVEKPSVQELELRTDRVDITVVALHSCKEVARAYVACKRVRRAGVWGKVLQMLSMGTGVAIAALLALFGNAPSSLFVTAWLMVWCALYVILSYTFLRSSNDENEEEI